MILIVDDDKTKRSRDIKSALSEYGIPSVVCGIGHIRHYPETLAVFCAVPSQDKLDLICVRCGRIPVIAENLSGSRIYNKDVSFYDSTACPFPAGFIISFLNERYGIIPSELRYGDLLILPDIIQYGIAGLRLTGTERRILVLLLLCKEKWVSEFCITHTCFRRVGAGNSTRVSVHICNLNRKARAVTGRNFILTKRGVGYMLDPTL